MLIVPHETKFNYKQFLGEIKYVLQWQKKL